MTIDTLERTDTKVELKELPRIYADGKNDDLPGLVAALKNESVEYDGDVLKPGEDLDVRHRHIRLTARIFVHGPGAEPVDHIGELKEGPYVVVNVPAELGRHITIAYSVIEMLDTPEWKWPSEVSAG